MTDVSPKSAEKRAYRKRARGIDDFGSTYTFSAGNHDQQRTSIEEMVSDEGIVTSQESMSQNSKTKEIETEEATTERYMHTK